MPADERVLCIPTAHFRSIGPFQGFREAEEAYRSRLLDPGHFSFHSRSEVEMDPSYKQLIPYVLLRHGDDLFHYRRGASGTETRLQALRSVGIGGHISEADAFGTGDPYTNGMMRELLEEVTIEGKWSEHLLGFINDDRTPVGSVHLGIVHLFELERAEVRSNETALADGGFTSLAKLHVERDQFETWSQFAMEMLK
jgi:predicted NUDIX family phosphoesterase